MHCQGVLGEHRKEYKRYRLFLALKRYLKSHQVQRHPFCRDSGVEILDVVSSTAHCKQQSSCHYFSQQRSGSGPHCFLHASGVPA